MIWCVLLLIKTNTQIKQSLHCSSNHGSVMFGCYSFVLKIATELWATWLPATNGSVSTLMEITILWVLSYSEVGLTAILWCIFVLKIIKDNKTLFQDKINCLWNNIYSTDVPVNFSLFCKNRQKANGLIPFLTCAWLVSASHGIMVQRKGRKRNSFFFQMIYLWHFLP